MKWCSVWVVCYFCEHTQRHLAQISAGVSSLCTSVKTRLRKWVTLLHSDGICSQIPHETKLQYKTVSVTVGIICFSCFLMPSCWNWSKRLNSYHRHIKKYYFCAVIMMWKCALTAFLSLKKMNHHIFLARAKMTFCRYMVFTTATISHFTVLQLYTALNGYIMSSM